MLTTVSEAEWADPSRLPTDTVLESMASRDGGFSKKVAIVICPGLDTPLFVSVLAELDLAPQEIHLDDAAGELFDFTWHIEPDDETAEKQK